MSALPEPADGDHNRARELDAVAWSWTTVATVFVFMRVYSRLRITRNIWWDDYFIVLTTLLMIITTIFWTVLGAKSGCRHLFYLTPQQAMTASRINWIAQPTAIMSIGFGKVSVAILILRIMGRSSKSLWRMTFLYVAAIGSVLFCALAIILTFAQCKPVQALWDPTLLETGKAKCWKPSTQTDFSLFVGSWLASMDVALALLPITIIAKLQMPLPKKILLSSLLGLGIFAAVCASIKTFELQSLNARSDITWQTVTLWIWNVNECGTVIIAACIPTLRPLYLIIFRRPGREVYRSNKRSHTYAHGVRKGYVRSGSRRRGWEGNSESTTAIGESNVQAEDTSWLEMGDQKVGKGDIRQTTDVEVERRERRGREDGDGVWGGGGGLGETRIVGPGSVV